MINILKILDYSCTGEKEYTNYRYKINLNFLKDSLYFLLEDDKKLYDLSKNILKDLKSLGSSYSEDLFCKEDFKLTDNNIKNMSYFESDQFISLISKTIGEDFKESYISDFKTNETDNTLVSMSLDLSIKNKNYEDKEILDYAYYIRDNYLFYNTEYDVTPRVCIVIEKDTERSSAKYSFILNKSIVLKNKNKNFIDEYLNKVKSNNIKSNCKFKLSSSFISVSGIIGSASINNKGEKNG